MHPLIDLSNLSNTQLIEKIALTSARVMSVRSSGQSSSIVDQLQMVMMACQDEMSRRAEPEVVNDPLAWDMDSYLTVNKERLEDSQQEEVPKWRQFEDSAADSDPDSPWG